MLCPQATISTRRLLQHVRHFQGELRSVGQFSEAWRFALSLPDLVYIWRRAVAGMASFMPCACRGPWGQSPQVNDSLAKASQGQARRTAGAACGGAAAAGREPQAGGRTRYRRRAAGCGSRPARRPAPRRRRKRAVPCVVERWHATCHHTVEGHQPGARGSSPPMFSNVAVAAPVTPVTRNALSLPRPAFCPGSCRPARAHSSIATKACGWPVAATRTTPRGPLETLVVFSGNIV